MRNLKKFCLLFLTITTCLSCKKEIVVHPTLNQQTKGRFDNKPFAWDYKSNPSSSKIFIGDIYLNKTIIEAKSQIASTKSLLIGSNPNIYPGGVYPKSTVDDFSFANEYPYEKNLFDYYFLFNRKFIVLDVFHKYGRGLREYYLAEDKALNSQQFTEHINSNEFTNVDYNIVEAYTYSDIEKNFAANLTLGKIFTSKMSQNKKNKNFNSIFFARLESSIFDVTFEPDYSNFFFDPKISNDIKTASFAAGTTAGSRINELNTSKYFQNGEPFFIRNVSYGRYAYLAIESEYSYSEVKKAVEGTIGLWKIKAGATYDEKTTEILSKSTVTLMMSGKTKESQENWDSSLDKLSNIFTVKYNKNSVGSPIQIELRNLKSNNVYIPTPIRQTTDNTRVPQPTPTSPDPGRSGNR